MGGYGSGRSPWRTRRWAVEECLGLSLAHLRSPLNRAADGGAPSLGTIRWTRREQVTSTVAYLVLPERSGTLPAVRLSYIAETRSGKSVQRVDTVQVTTTPMPRGGKRWWWLCPYPRRGVPCGRRVGKLYLPPGETTFGCRLCHDLTYTSCLESHKYDALAAHLAARWSSEFPGVTPRAVKWVLRALRNLWVVAPPSIDTTAGRWLALRLAPRLLRARLPSPLVFNPFPGEAEMLLQLVLWHAPLLACPDFDTGQLPLS